MKEKVILTKNLDGENITLATLEQWIKQKDKINLSKFIYNRLYSRYIKPFEYNSSSYINEYKNGFTIMANCCLLIETFISFKEHIVKDTKHNSQRCFGLFFTSSKRFAKFLHEGKSYDFYRNPKSSMKEDTGIPRDFYYNVRCGILHNGETRNNWKITRQKNAPYFDETTKTINATKFMNRLKYDLKDFQQELESTDINSDAIWKVYLESLQFLIKKI